MSEVAEAPVVETPVVETPTPAPVAEPDTLAAHEDAFGPNKSGPDDDDDGGDGVEGEQGQQRGRGSRAKSKQAAARIDRLNREKGDLQREIDALKAKVPAPVQSKPSVPYVPPVPSVDFNEAEPTLDQFADKDDPYGAWQRELARYDRRKEAAEQQAVHMRAHAQMQSQQVEQYWTNVRLTHQQRLVEAVRANPASAAALQSVQVAPPELLDRAIMLDSDSANVALFLATHPQVLDEFVLYTEAKPVTEQTVAITRRLLRQRMTAAASGSVAPSPVFTPAPSPPKPLRTGSLTTADGPPGDDSSLAAHEKFYGRKRR